VPDFSGGKRELLGVGKKTLMATKGTGGMERRVSRDILRTGSKEAKTERKSLRMMV